MAFPRNSSPQTQKVLASLASEAQTWRYGYELSKETKLGSGTLYPLLIRLHDQGFLEAKWVEAARPGSPSRHAYRLTRAGIALAQEQGESWPILTEVIT